MEVGVGDCGRMEEEVCGIVSLWNGQIYRDIGFESWQIGKEIDCKRSSEWIFAANSR